MSFATYADAMARNYPDQLAMSDHAREVTFAELAGETDAVANALADLGVEAGDRVALYLPNSVAFMAAYLGAMKRWPSRSHRRALPGRGRRVRHRRRGGRRRRPTGSSRTPSRSSTSRRWST